MSAIANESIWCLQTPDVPTYLSLNGDVETDIAVIGAGITGLTTALRLLREGRRVVVIDALQVGKGVSGYNSGHLTSVLLDMGYSTVLSNFGQDQAHLVAASQMEALDWIENQVQLLQIDCDFKRVPGYLYAEEKSQVKPLEEELKATQRVGLASMPTDSVPVPFPTARGVLFHQQAQFNPYRYCLALAAEVTRLGGQLYENARVTHIEPGKTCQITIETGTIQAKKVVLATHAPIEFWPSVQTRVEPLMSYIVCVRVQNRLETALYWDMNDPYHYMRVVEEGAQPLIIIGGEDHRTGEKRDTRDAFDALYQYAEAHYDVIDRVAQWSAQLFDPADGLPYIGPSPVHPEVYIATGYSGEGLTAGTYAGNIIADEILGIENPYAKIYKVSRLKPLAAAAEFAKTNLDTAVHFVADRLKPADTKDFDGIANNTGAIVHCQGKQVAAYRDASGELHAMSPVCTHMSCIVNWNNQAKSWDCPCHGGRFEATGAVLEGPPVTPLQSLNLAELTEVHTN